MQYYNHEEKNVVTTTEIHVEWVEAFEEWVTYVCDRATILVCDNDNEPNYLSAA